MIAFKDFAPQQTAPGSLLSLPVYEMFDRAVETGDPLLRGNSDFPIDWYQFVRVWYQSE